MWLRDTSRFDNIFFLVSYRVNTQWNWGINQGLIIFIFISTFIVRRAVQKIEHLSHDLITIINVSIVIKSIYCSLLVHIHWASHARNQWSHVRLQFFFLMQGFIAVFFHHIVIVSDITYHNMVKNTVYLCIPYSLLPVKMKPCMRCSVYVHH